MQFDLSKPQKLLQESARTLFDRECSLERVRELMETPDAFDAGLWEQFVDQGWTGLVFPESVDGLELGTVELAALMEEMGRACVPGPYLSNLAAGVLLDALKSHDLAEARLRELIDGKARVAVAWHEADPSWDPASAAMFLERAAGEIRLFGTKTLVMGAPSADWVLTLVRDDNELAIASLPVDLDRIQVTATGSIDPTRSLGSIRFEDALVKEDDILARGAAAEAAVKRMTQVGAVMACADMVGGMQWMLETAVEYAKTREQFGRPIGAYQMVQEQCADMLLLIESARSATYYAAWTLDESDEEADRAVSMAKAYCSDAGREVGNRSIQVHGGIGFTWEHDLHLYYKRAKASELMFGDATFHREALARQILD